MVIIQWQLFSLRSSQALFHLRESDWRLRAHLQADRDAYDHRTGDQAWVLKGCVKYRVDVTDQKRLVEVKIVWNSRARGRRRFTAYQFFNEKQKIAEAAIIFWVNVKNWNWLTFGPDWMCWQIFFWREVMRDSLNEYFSKHLFATVESLQITEDDLPDARRPWWFPWWRMVGWLDGWCLLIVGWLVGFSFCNVFALASRSSWSWVVFFCRPGSISRCPLLVYSLTYFLVTLVMATGAPAARLGLYPHNPHSCYKQAEHH